MLAARRASLAIVLAASSMIVGQVFADDVYWTGGGLTDNWTNTNNWFGFNRPDNNGEDRVVFDGNRNNRTNYVNESYWIKSLWIRPDGITSTSYTIKSSNSSILSIADKVTNLTSNSQWIHTSLKFTANGKLTNNEDNTTYGWMEFYDVDTNGKTVTLQPSTNNMSFNGWIIGSGKIVLDGPGTATFGATNHFSGGLELKRGTFNAGWDGNLGASANAVTFSPYSGYTPTLRWNDTTSTARTMYFNAGEGRIEIPQRAITHSGAFTGPGDAAKTGGGALVLTGQFTGFGGTFHAREGLVYVNRQSAFNETPLVIYSGAEVEYSGNIGDRIGSLNGAGKLTLSPGVGLAIGANEVRNGGGTFSGQIVGNGTVELVKSAAGTLNLTGNSPQFTGTTSVYGGTLLANNIGTATVATAGDVVVMSGGRFGGDGSIGGKLSLRGGGVVAPSQAATPGLGVGSLDLGLVEFEPNAIAEFDLTNAGGDSLYVEGAATLRGTLALSRVNNVDLTGNKRKIIHAGGGVAGKFNAITGMTISSTKRIAITYDNTGVYFQPARPGDADLNGSVGFDDLLALAQSYSRTSEQSWVNGDFNGDSAVGFEDLLALAQFYGSNGLSTDIATATSAGFAADWALAQSMVPEPTTLAGLAGASMLTLRRRRSNE